MKQFKSFIVVILFIANFVSGGFYILNGMDYKLESDVYSTIKEYMPISKDQSYTDISNKVRKICKKPIYQNFYSKVYNVPGLVASGITEPYREGYGFDAEIMRKKLFGEDFYKADIQVDPSGKWVNRPFLGIFKYFLWALQIMLVFIGCIKYFIELFTKGKNCRNNNDFKNNMAMDQN